MDVLLKATETLWQRLREIALDDATVMNALMTAEHACLSREHTAVALALSLAMEKQELLKKNGNTGTREFSETDVV
jgi:hypothetical protein